jgi:hypothetical protein
LATEVLLLKACDNPQMALVCAEAIHLLAKNNIIKGKNEGLENI